MADVQLYNDTLNPDLWDESMNLRTEVSQKLLEIAMDFYNDIQLGISLKDIIMKGSSTNYNWTPTSDIDVHLVVDRKEINMNEKQAKTYFNALKSKWNDEHNIFIKKQNVELYIQDVTDIPRVNSAVYSILKGQWLKKPVKEKLLIDRETIKDKYDDFVYRYKMLLKNPDVNNLNRLIANLYKMRESGLSNSGELSNENIAFKLLRKNGYINKLKQLRDQTYDKDMSISEKGI